VRTIVLMSVWIYTLLTVVLEVFISQNVPSAAPAVVVFALSQAAAVLLFYMELKDAPGSVIVMFMIPLMFIAGLLISIVASLG